MRDKSKHKLFKKYSQAKTFKCILKHLDNMAIDILILQMQIFL